MSFIIFIQGGTSSGKSTLSDLLVNTLKKEFSALLIRQDDYYKDLSDLSAKEIINYNFDSPEAIDMKMFAEDIEKLMLGKSVQKREYDFVKHENHKTENMINPADILVCEGLFVFDSDVKSNLNIFLEVDDDIRLIRRLQRDRDERNILPDKTIKQYLNTVKPMHDKYIKPAKKKADMILQNNQSIDSAFTVFVNTIIAEIKRRIL